MARGRLVKEEIEILKKNPYVQDVSETRIIYTNAFKFRFMKEYMDGKKPKVIFEDAGFDAGILGSKRIERAAHRWRESYAAGSLGAYKDGTIRKRMPEDIKDIFSGLSYEECLNILKEQQGEIGRLKSEIAQLKLRYGADENL